MYVPSLVFHPNAQTLSQVFKQIFPPTQNLISEQFQKARQVIVPTDSTTHTRLRYNKYYILLPEQSYLIEISTAIESIRLYYNSVFER